MNMRLVVLIVIKRKQLNYDSIKHGYYRHLISPRVVFLLHLVWCLSDVV